MSIIKNFEHSVRDLEKINTVIDPRQKIAPFGGIWWLRSFIERLGIVSVLGQGYGIKKRLRKFNESDYFLSALYLLNKWRQEHIRYRQTSL